jgi:hypothetical protein
MLCTIRITCYINTFGINREHTLSHIVNGIVTITTNRPRCYISMYIHTIYYTVHIIYFIIHTIYFYLYVHDDTITFYTLINFNILKFFLNLIYLIRKYFYFKFKLDNIIIITETQK